MPNNLINKNKVTIKSVFLLTPLLTFSLLPQPLLAQNPTPVMIDVSSCLPLESTLERYDCYEKQVKSNQAPSIKRSSITLTKPVVAKDENFGFPPKEDSDKKITELTSTITALRQTVPNRYLIGLENGQIWRQMTSKRYPLQIGHQVRIYPSKWGSAYRLSVEKLSGFIQVERRQ